VARASDVAEVVGLSDLPGLAARLAAMAAELRLVARNTPLWAMAETGLGDAIERAQAVREMAHNLSAVLAAG
jgi:2-methylisocitrate lyase-like PEP mutase family enzyme